MKALKRWFGWRWAVVDPGIEGQRPRVMRTFFRMFDARDHAAIRNRNRHRDSVMYEVWARWLVEEEGIEPKRRARFNDD